MQSRSLRKPCEGTLVPELLVRQVDAHDCSRGPALSSQVGPRGPFALGRLLHERGNRVLALWVEVFDMQGAVSHAITLSSRTERADSRIGARLLVAVRGVARYCFK
jgi:hypothetical protein